MQGFVFILYFLHFLQPVLSGKGSQVEETIKGMPEVVTENDKICFNMKTLDSTGKSCANTPFPFLDPNASKLERKKREVTKQPPPLFIPTAFPGDFADLDLNDQQIPSYYHTVRPGGYSTSDRYHLLQFKTESFEYPPFSYRGFFGTNLWHKIDIRTLMRRINRSFMMLADTCDERAEIEHPAPASKAPAGTAESTPTNELNDKRRKFIKDCEKKLYKEMYPVCNSETQSPINIITSQVENSTLPPYTFSNMKDSGVQMIMTLPWDGTNILTLELLGAVRDPKLSLGKITADIAQDVETGNVTFQHTPQISFGSLTGPDLYLDRAHIKYGAQTYEGSEHLIDGKAFSMELQFIFTQFGRSTNRKYWQRLQSDYIDIHTSGRTSELGKYVHILAMFVEVVNDTEYARINRNSPWNRGATEAFDSISLLAKKFWKVASLDNKVASPLDGNRFRAYRSNPAIGTSEKSLVKLQQLLPPIQDIDARGKPIKPRKSTYFAYRGGLTHPPCFDNIDWAVYNVTLKINQTMWKRFRYIPSEFDDSGFVAGNFRNVSSIYFRATDLTVAGNTIDSVEAAELRLARRRVRRSRPEIESAANEDYYEDYNRGISLQLPLLFIISSICLVILLS